jgi:tetratricopeptide (TPR) repeat protein
MAIPSKSNARLRTLSMALILTVLSPGLAIAQSASESQAEQKAKAIDRYSAGARKFDVGRFDEAAADFSAAYELSGAPEILFNMGTAYRAAKKYDKALISYRAYLRRVPDAPQREIVQQRITELTDKLNQEQQREQREKEEARRQREEEALFRRQQLLTVQPKTPIPPPRWMQPAGIGLAAVGLAGVATGVAMSTLARSASNTVQSAAASHAVFDSGLHDTEARGKAEDSASIACYVAGGALIATGVTLIAVARARKRAASSFAIAPVATPRSAGVFFEGNF